MSACKQNIGIQDVERGFPRGGTPLQVSCTPHKYAQLPTA